MNPLSNVRFIKELNQREIRLGIKESSSWHNEYKDSAWVFIGGLPFELTEGDVLAVFSQYGEIVNLNLVRDKATGKSKGYCFLCYEDQRSTILAVDNLNGIKLCKRTIRVDHVANYRMPKDHEDTDDITLKLRAEGCAPSMASAVKEESESEDQPQNKKSKNAKLKAKKQKKKKKKHSKKNESSSEGESDTKTLLVKKEKTDPGYEKYENGEFASKSRNKTTIKNVHEESRRSSASINKHDSPDRTQEYSTDAVSSKKHHEAYERTLNARTSQETENRSLEYEYSSKQNVSLMSKHKAIRTNKSVSSGKSSDSPSQGQRGRQLPAAGSPDRTKTSRPGYTSTSANLRDNSTHRTKSSSSEKGKIFANRESSPPPTKRRSRTSQSPDVNLDSIRRASRSVRRVSRSASPNERKFNKRTISQSPPPKCRDSRSPVQIRLSRTSISPLPDRRSNSYRRVSRSPPTKHRNDNGRRESPNRNREQFRRYSRSPPTKRANYGHQSRSPDRRRDPRNRGSISPPVRPTSKKRESTRRMSRSPSPDVRSYSKQSSRMRSPDIKFDSRDSRRRNR